MSDKVVAQLNNLRISPRKVRLVVDQIRGLGVKEALVILNYNLKKPSDIVAKLILSALASAENDFKFNRNDLFISEIYVNAGSTLKRWMPRAYGRAYQILKRTSKLKLVLSRVSNLDDKVMVGDVIVKKNNN
jgi:large subunit ribosomal protein L22